MKKENKDEFISGLVYAIQEMVVNYKYANGDQLAEWLVKSSGYSLDDFLKEQKRSGVYSREMNKFFKEVFLTPTKGIK